MQVERACPVCAQRYAADATRLRFGRQTTCSRACSYRLRADVLTTAVEVTCGGCAKVFAIQPLKRERARHGGSFCSLACAYANRKRIVSKPYVLIAEVDRVASSLKAWETRRANPKPYPEAARAKARAQAIARVVAGGGVSKFERAVAETLRTLRFLVSTSVAVRDARGRFAHVFDLVLPQRALVIECHGSYWHGERWTWSEPNHSQERNLRYEAKKHALAKSIGLDLRLLWEHDYKRDAVGACLAAVR